MNGKSAAAAAGIIICLGFLTMFGLGSARTEARPASLERPDGWCSLPLAAGNTATGLGPMDYNAGYNGFMARLNRGETAVLQAQFPHSRYASVMVYDQDFLLLDAILDRDIVPGKGVNPFVSGTDRSAEYLGEFEIQIKMEPPPRGEREPNTLYAGLTHDGRPNRLAVVGYRVYLPDRGYGFKDGNPLAVYGGVPAPRFRIVAPDGAARCPDPRINRFTYFQLLGGLLLRNWKNILHPNLGIGELTSPPTWINNASKETQKLLSFVPCPDTNYIMTPISRKFGELIVFRFQQARIPIETFQGRPFPRADEYDVRYWSISFDYFDRSRPEQIFCEQTVSDLEVPRLPDGTSQLVVGLGGVERPAAVVPEQWVGLKLAEGIAVVRNIVVNPDYPGYFWKLSPGPVPREYDEYTPGGVYCSVDEFSHDPELGRRRKELIK